MFKRVLKIFLKKIWYLFFSEHPYTYPGRFLIKILPDSYIYSDYCNEFLSGKVRSRFLDRFIRAELNRQYYSMGEDERRRVNKEKFWGSIAGKKWHDVKKKLYSHNEKFENEFLKFRAPLVGQISELLSTSDQYHTICEIGTGHGMFLHYLSAQFHQVREFVGIDLNKQQILENQAIYKNSRLKFVPSEISDWINTQCEPGTIFVACGTFEYFYTATLQ